MSARLLKPDVDPLAAFTHEPAGSVAKHSWKLKIHWPVDADLEEKADPQFASMKSKRANRLCRKVDWWQ
jgi:hypothetical protein